MSFTKTQTPTDVVQEVFYFNGLTGVMELYHQLKKANQGPDLQEAAAVFLKEQLNGKAKEINPMLVTKFCWALKNLGVEIEC